MFPPDCSLRCTLTGFSETLVNREYDWIATLVRNRYTMAVREELRIFSSFQEAEEADAAFYASLSPQERLDLLLDIIARHRESLGETAEDLRELIELLNSHRVEYLVVGRHAVSYHGYPRYTGDIDFLVRPTQENASRVAAAVQRFGFGGSEALKSTLVQPEKVVQIGRPPNRIDILTSASGVDFQDAWERSVTGSLDGIPVRFPDLGTLLKNKRASGRIKDLADVEELEKVSKRR